MSTNHKDVDFGDMGLTRQQDHDVREVLAKWEGERQRLCRARMKLAAKAGGQRRFFTTPDGNGGEVKMMVDEYSYHYWGQRMGYKCWDDAEFCREFLRDNPEARVRSSFGDKITLVVRGLASCVKRFSKVYTTNPNQNN